MTRPSVVIVGGGISGLCAAYELSGGTNGPNESTPRIEIIEAGSRFGGSMATATFAGRTIDLGADGFLTRRPEAIALARDLGLGAYLEDVAASGASIYLGGFLDPLPHGSVLGVPTSRASLRTLRGLPRVARRQAWRDEHFPRRVPVSGDVSIGHLLRAKLGSTLTYQLIEPMIGGIQAGRIDELSAESVFPALLAAARKKGSLMKNLRGTNALTRPDGAEALGPVFSSLTTGVASLVDALVEVLQTRGVHLRTNVTVGALRHRPQADYPWEVDTPNTTTAASVVVLATPASVTGYLAGPHHPALARLQGVTNAGTAMITLQFSSSDLELPTHGTGVLIPLNTPLGDDFFLTTALTFLDRKWRHLRRDGDLLVRAHVGRSDDRRWSIEDDDTLTARVLDELRIVLSTSATPLATMVQRWPEGLPQYFVGHADIVAHAQTAAEQLGLVLVGNAYDGVGIPACIGSGRAGGRRALQRL